MLGKGRETVCMCCVYVCVCVCVCVCGFVCVSVCGFLCEWMGDEKTVGERVQMKGLYLNTQSKQLFPSLCL